MSSLRLVASDPQAGEARIPRSPGDRRAKPDRRSYERRNHVYPFESRENRLRFAAQAAGFGTYDFDCSTGDSVWSPELRAMIGLPPDSTPLSTEQVESLIHPDDRPGFLQKLQESLRPEGSGEFEDDHRLLRPDGTACWVRTKGRTFFIEQGEIRRPLATTGVVMDMTASRIAAEQLAESREELDRMVETAIDAIVTLDAEQRIVRFNPSAARMFGCTAEEVIGSRVERFMPERYRATHADRVRQFAEGRPRAQALDSPRRFTGLRADGEEFMFEATITKVNVDGSNRMTTFMRDITDRVRAEEALQRSKEDLELAVRGGNIGIWRWDARSQEYELSERCRQLFGIRADEPLNYERLLATIHPEDRERVREARRRALEENEEYKAEKRVVWPDGSIHWIESIGRAFHDAAPSKAIGLRGIAIDITDRKEAEEALRRSKEDLELAVRGANIGIWHWDLRAGKFDVSDRCRQLFGLPAREPLNYHDILDAIHPDDQAMVEEGLRCTLERGAEYKIEKRFVWPDGSVHWLECIGRELCDPNSNKPFGIRGISLDITERKLHEEALQHSKETLETCVAERTAELMHANEALERSNLELQQFAFIAAHDLQTPLRSISSFAQLLQKDFGGQLGPTADAWLEQLVRSAHRMRDVIQDVLAYSRVESRGEVFQTVDFNALFDDVVGTLDAPIRESGALVLRGDLPSVQGDRGQLSQVLQNLIENAMKYRSDEPPQVCISAGRQDGEWVFAVRDNGIGIPEKHLEHVFDIFRRLHTQQEFPGTGIGLAICRRVIHRHGGRIWAESQPGKGSSFFFTLPAREADGEEAQPETD